jgi:hypothetical protein
VDARAVLAGVSFEQRWRLTPRGEEAWRAYLAELHDVLSADAAEEARVGGKSFRALPP